MSGPVALKNKEHRISVSGKAMIPSTWTLIKPPQGFSQLPAATTITTTRVQNSHQAISKSSNPLLPTHGTEKQQHVAEWLFRTQQHHGKPEGTSAGKKLQMKKTSLPKKSVYLSETLLDFPRTAAGTQVVVKVRVCNRDSVTHHFTVIKPSKPFSVNHLNFSLE